MIEPKKMSDEDILIDSENIKNNDLLLQSILSSSNEHPVVEEQLIKVSMRSETVVNVDSQ